MEEIKEFLNRVGNKDPDATRGSVGNPFKPQAPWGGGKGFMAWTSASLDPMVRLSP